MALMEYPLAELLTRADGRTVEWEAVGDGPPLMWVEGGPGFWAHLARPDVQMVSDLFRCHLLNAPRCGRTSPPADIAGYDLPAIIAFFEEVRDSLGLGRVSVMGHSWGGLVVAAWAAAAASMAPERPWTTKKSQLSESGPMPGRRPSHGTTPRCALSPTKTSQGIRRSTKRPGSPASIQPGRCTSPIQAPLCLRPTSPESEPRCR